MIHHHIRPSSPIIAADHPRHAFLAMPGMLRKKIFFSFLFLCLVQPVYSMKKNDEGYFSYFYNLVNKYSYRRTSYDPFCHAVKLACKSNFAQEDCEEIKKHILNGANPNWKIGKREIPTITRAVYHQKKDLFNFLLQQNADINAYDKGGSTPLHDLVLVYDEFERLDITIRDLIQHGANIKAKDIHGFTPLLSAVLKGNINCIKSLVECSADINEKSTTMTPLEIAVQKEVAITAPIEVIKGLCKLNASLVVDNFNIFHYILLSRDDSIEYIKPIITHARFDSYDKKSQTVRYALLVFSKCGLTQNDKDVKLHILSKLLPSELYPYKSVCRELLKRNYNHILLPQVYERVENIKQILAKKNGKNQTALEYALEKFANNQELIKEIGPILDGTMLDNDFNDFIANFPAIVNSQAEEDKDNLVRQMFDNCAQLFLEQ